MKLLAPDGKRRLTDVLDNNGVIKLAQSMQNTKSARFIQWFTYSEDSIDGKSKSKAYALFESGLINRGYKSYKDRSHSFEKFLPLKYKTHDPCSIFVPSMRTEMKTLQLGSKNSLVSRQKYSNRGRNNSVLKDKKTLFMNHKKIDKKKRAQGKNLVSSLLFRSFDYFLKSRTV